MVLSSLEKDDLLRDFPIADFLDGWYFRVSEVANQCYRAEGSNLLRQEVACSGNTPEEALEKCKRYALEIDLR